MRVLSRVVVYLLLVNIILLGVYFFTLKREPYQQREELDKAYKSGSERHIPHLHYKDGKIVEFGISLLDSVENGGEEDRFEVSGVVERIWSEDDRIFLKVILPEHDGLRLTFDMGEKQDIIGVNKAKEGEIGRYTSSKVGDIFHSILPNTPVLLHAISRMNTRVLGEDCDKECRALVEYINSNYSQFSSLLFEIVQGEKVHPPDRPVGYVSQVVYYQK